jgi:hypothetical protein
MSLQLLRQEIQTDPESLGYSGKTAEQISAILSARNRPALLPVSSANLLAWAAAEGRLARISDAAADGNLPAALRSIAKAASLMLERDGTTLDLSLPDRMNLVNGLVQATILTAADKTSLVELATVNISRLQELALPDYHAGDVQTALN